MRITILLSVLLLLVIFTGCSVKKYKNISYLEKDAVSSSTSPTLNIFTSKKDKNANAPVLIFIHGGNWNSGKKELYSFFGKNFARKGITAVIVGYTLSPDADYKKMTQQVAQAIKWTKNNIANYNGDPEQIFLTGHSAGGHLVTLAAIDPANGINGATVSGIILNDAAGLDMHHYLQQNPPTTTDDYLATWTNEPETWKKASPVFFLDEKAPPFLIFLGMKTYPSITTANARFSKELKKYQPEVKTILLDKKHVPMMTQYIWPWSNRYEEIINFMEANK